MWAAAQMFGVKDWEVQRPSGEVDLLIGIKAASIFPTVERTEGNLRLFPLQFWMGWLINGTNPKVMRHGARLLNEAHCVSWSMIGSRSWAGGALDQHFL